MNLNPAAILYLVRILFIPTVKGAIPGTFFWKPRLDIKLEVPDVGPLSKVSENAPLEFRIVNGTAVLINGYRLVVSMTVLTSAIKEIRHSEHQNPFTAAYHTNMYRWALRYLSSLPGWLSGMSNHYTHTHKVWENRYQFKEDLVPSWLRSLFFYVSKDDWERDEKTQKRFQKYAEQAFSTGYVYSVPEKASTKTKIVSLDSSSYSFKE